MPDPMPLPVPVPAPPPLPDPSDRVGGPGAFSIDARQRFGRCDQHLGRNIQLFDCGGGSFFASSLTSSFGGFSTGTVILSLPGSSATFGGSFILLPPPPPPPPGPGSFSQTICSLASSGSVAAELVSADAVAVQQDEQQHDAGVEQK